MSLDYFLSDCETKAGAALILATAGIVLVETGPDLLLGFFTHSDTLVLDRNLKLLAFFNYIDVDMLALRSKLKCVVYQVINNLLNLGLISRNDSSLSVIVEVDSYIFIYTFNLKCVQRRFDYIYKIEICKVQIWTIYLETVQIEQSLSKFGQTIGLVHNDAQVSVLLLRRNGSILDSRYIATNRSKWASEVVGYVGNELVPVFFELR